MRDKDSQSHLGNLQNLATLDLGDNYFHSSLPKTFYQLYNLTSCLITSSKLTGTISPFVGNLTKLRVLDISHNLLHSSIPREIGNLINLNILYLSNNQLTNIIPTSILNLTSLDALYLQSNFLFGKADFLSNMNLNIFYLHENFLTGTFSFGPTLFQKVTYFDLSQNSFTGPLPWLEDVDAPYLAWYIIFTNFFTGNFPTVAKTPLLRFYVTKENQITGSIPSHFFINSTRSLYYLSLAENYYSGTIPLSIGNFTKINQFDFNNNLFNGKLPETIVVWKGISKVKTSFKGLIMKLKVWRDALKSEDPKKINILRLSLYFGEVRKAAAMLSIYSLVVLIPTYANLTVYSATYTIQYAWTISAMLMSGATTAIRVLLNIDRKAPKPVITNSEEIERSSDDRNGFTGTLPSSFRKSVLTNVSLSYNQLTGTIPMSWSNHKWKLLDLSYNKLIGNLPEGSEEFNNVKAISSTISLEVNRLSGIIPSDVTSFPGSISILKGNMLSCNFFKEELPKNDPDYDTYVCGSNMVNNSIYLWLMVGISLWFFAIGIAGIRKMQSRVSDGKGVDCFRWFGEVVYRVCKSLLIDNSSDLPEAMVKSSSRYPSTFNFFSFTLHIRQYAVLVLCFMAVVLLPAYGILGVYYRTYEERYAWSISAAFLSGTEATVTLMVLFVVLVVLSVYLVHELFRKAVKEYYNRHVYCVRGWWLCENWRGMGLWTIAWLINGMIMITADSLYVSLIINRSTKYDYLIQMTLAMFKLVWHDMGIFQMIHQLKRNFTETTMSRDEWKQLHSFEDDSNVSVPAVTMIMVMLYERLKEQQSTSRWGKLVFDVAKRFLPLGWGGVAREEDKIEFRRRAKTKILHRKQLLTLRISYTFAVMFVFGSLFPPLALIATIAILNITMLEEYLTKTMLRQCCELRSDDEDGDGDVSSTDYLDEVERECKDIEWNWFKIMSERKRKIQVLTEKALTVFIAYYFSLDSIRFLYYMKVNDGSNYQNHDQVMAAVDAVRVLTMMREHDVCSKGLFVVNVCLELLYEGKAVIEEVIRYKQIMKELRLNAVLLARARGAEDNEDAYFWKRVSEEKNNFDVDRGSQLASRVYRQAVHYARSLHNRTKGEKSSKMLSKIRHFILPRLESEVPKLYSKDVQMLEEGRNRYYESQMDVSKNQEGNNNMMYDIWREILCGSFKQPFYVAAEAFQLAKKGGFVGEIYKKAGEMFVDGAREIISEDRVVTSYYAVKSAKNRSRNDVLMSGNFLLSLARSVDAAYQIAQHHRRLYSYLLRQERLLNQSNQLFTTTYEPLPTITFIQINFIQLFTEMTFVSNSIIKCLELMISTEKLSDQSKLIIENCFSFCNNIHSLVQAIYMTEKELQGFIQKIHENFGLRI
eukprot:gene8247-8919_t